MFRTHIILLFAYLCPFLFFQNAAAQDKLTVFVSINPQKYFVQQIGKDLVDVQVMVQPGADPHTYEPRPRQMAAISRAKLYFAIGIEFERANLEKIVSANRKLKIIHTDLGIEKMPMRAHHEYGKNGGHPREGDHHGEDGHHGTPDPHIWLSPPLVKIQARTILAALQEIDPAHGSAYEANFRQFEANIDRLDADLKQTFEGRQGLQFMVFHPSWGYFAQAYGLKQVPIEIQGKNPKPAQIKALIEHAREKGIKVVFVQPQFSARNAQLVAREIGGQTAVVDPMALDWMANLRRAADKFRLALK